MAQENQTFSKNEIFTPANIVTLVRIIFIPILIVIMLTPWPDWFVFWENAELWKSWIAAGVFLILAATDGLDGYLARSRNEVTDFGKFIDPIADKLLVMAALLALIEQQILPSWIAMIIIAREFIVSGLRMVAASKGVVIAAAPLGKIKTVLTIIAIVLFMVKDSVFIHTFGPDVFTRFYYFSWFVMLLAVLFTLLSMADYFRKAYDLVSSPKEQA